MNHTSYRVKFAGGSGFDLVGIVDRPQHESLDDSTSQPVLVFSHCFTCNKDLKAIVRIGRGLARRGIAVLRFDMTGLGGSDGDFSQTNFSTNQQDLRAAIKFARGELGPVTTLLGHSFGGAASMAVAAEFSSKFKSIVTLAAPSDTGHLAVLLSKMNPQIDRIGIGDVSIGGRTWTIRREMLEDFRRHDLPASISKITRPTMILHSPADKTVHYDHALRILGLVQQSGAAVSLVSLQGADHLLSTNQSDIEFVTETIAAFVHRYGIAD